MPFASAGLSTLLGVLALGGRVVLVDIAGDGAGGSLKLIEREAVTVAAFGPATLGMMLGLQRARSAFRAVRVVRLGGNSVVRADLPAWRAVLPADCIILHSYASTEALIMAQWIVPVEDGGKEIRVPAGILHLCHDYAMWDAEGQPVAPGEDGELVLRSHYVALGEWRDGRVVAGRMTPVPGRPGWRLFRTGDVVRIGTDGMLRVLGRADRQVKINGVLVQPAEIEAVLKAEPRVADAAVVAACDAVGDHVARFCRGDRGRSGGTCRGAATEAGEELARGLPATAFNRVGSVADAAGWEDRSWCSDAFGA